MINMDKDADTSLISSWSDTDASSLSSSFLEPSQEQATTETQLIHDESVEEPMSTFTSNKHDIYLEDHVTSSVRWLQDDNETTPLMPSASTTAAPTPSTKKTSSTPPGYFTTNNKDYGYDGPSTFDRGLQMVFSSFFVVVFW